MKPFRFAQLNRSSPLARGLVGCWLFNEGCGKIVTDISGNNNNGTLCNNTTWAAGRFGTCLSFNGSGDYVNLGNKIALQVGVPFSISAWIYINSLVSDSWLIGTDKYGLNDSGGKYYGCHLRILNTGAVYAAYGDGSGNTSNSRRTAQTTTTPIAADKWYYIVVVCRGPADWTIAVNRINQPVVCSGTGGSIAYSVSPAVLGQNQSISNPFWFNGWIDNCFIFNRALSMAEMSCLYYEPFCLFEQAGAAGHLLHVQSKCGTGNAKGDYNADADANILSYIPQLNLPWRQDALFNAATASAIRLGTVLSLGWFWNRPSGCLILYRGESADNIDYTYPVCAADTDARQLELPAWVKLLPGETNFYLVRKYNGFGRSSCCCLVAKVSFDDNGKLISSETGRIYDFSARQTGGSTVEFRWFYNSLNQQIKPASFKLFWDAGSGQINYGTPLEHFNYRGSGFYSYSQIGGFPRLCKFGICAADADGKCGPMSCLEILVNSVVARQPELLTIESL
jgi:hypothetical protein